LINVVLPAAAGAAAAPAPINLINNYGQVTLEQVQVHAAVYMAVQERLNQQSLLLYDFLCDSIDDKALTILNIRPGNFTINWNPEGACFLKEIITKSYVDTNATVDTIRKAISRLDDRIKEVKFDIKNFNEYVWSQVNSLSAHGVQCTELLTNVLSAYKQIHDTEFS
jgi:hypothetical protein